MDSEIKWKVAGSKHSPNHEASIGGYRVAIHGYVGYGDRLFMSCYSLRIERKDLGTEDLGEAKQKALQILKEALQERISADQAALAQIEYAETGYLMDRLDQLSAGMAVLPGVWEHANV